MFNRLKVYKICLEIYLYLVIFKIFLICVYVLSMQSKGKGRTLFCFVCIFYFIHINDEVVYLMSGISHMVCFVLSALHFKDIFVLLCIFTILLYSHS